MNARLQEILEQMKALEQDLIAEIHKAETDFLYKIHGRRVVFNASTKARHGSYAVPLLPYLRDSPLLNILSAPIIWSCLVPIVLLDLSLTIYQAVCFPIYGIPKVRRKDHIIMDRSRIQYLNIIEKINCGYCSYFTGVISFVQEIAGRTEQYWCPIKSARRLGSMHSRYIHFLEFGDAESYRTQLNAVRNNFQDLEKPDE